MLPKVLYSAFIAYNHRDKRWVREFVSLLKSAGVAVFFDDDAIAFGANIPTEIAEGLASSRSVLVMLSRNSVQSPWLRYEFSQMIMRDSDGRNKSIIPVLLDDLAREHLPESLTTFKAADFSIPETRQDAFVALLKQLGVDAISYPTLPPYPLTTSIRSSSIAKPARKGRSAPPMPQKRKLAILGAGYVGSSLAAALVASGHTVIAIERDPLKVAALQRGRSHLYEPGVEDLLEAAYKSKALSAEAVIPETRSGIDGFICTVGPTLAYDDAASEQWLTDRYFQVLSGVGQTIREWNTAQPIPIIVSATLRPEDCRRSLEVLQEATGAPEGRRFFFAVCPLFMREGTMLADLRTPPLLVVGSADGRGNPATTLFETLIKGLGPQRARNSQPAVQLPMEAACLVKLSSNAFHALKVAFSNEVARLCRASGVSAFDVMAAFARDATLNISSAYLRPGPAFGGSCLRKDVYALTSIGGTRPDESLGILKSIQRSNSSHLRSCANRIVRAATQLDLEVIGVYGLTFKPGTDDMRDSPSIALIEALPRSMAIRATDPDLLRTPTLTGGNLAHWQKTLKQINVQLVYDPVEIARCCRLLVITKAGSFDYEKLIPELNRNHTVLDLIGEWSPALRGELPCKWELLI